MLSLSGITAGYGQLKVLHNVTLDVPAGQVVALLGGNGAGKTTTMRAIAGLIPIQAGTIVLDGSPIGGMPAHRVFARGLSLVAQGRELFPEMTVRENLELGALQVSATTKPRCTDEIFGMFPRLLERASNRAASLSGGEQQMLATGRALMSRPKVLLLDEPTTGLAPIIVDELTRMLTELSREGQTILIVEQNTRMALKLAQHIYVIRQGEIVLDRPAGEIAGDDEMFEAYLG